MVEFTGIQEVPSIRLRYLKNYLILFSDARYYEDEEVRPYHHRETPVPKTRQKYIAEDIKYNSKRYDEEEREFNNNNQQQEQMKQRYIEEMKRKHQMHKNEENNGRYYGTERSNASSSVESKQRQKYVKDYYESTSRKSAPESRQRSPSPVEDVTPRDRFKDAKEKFLLLEKERLEQERKLRLDNHREIKHIGNYLRRNDSLTYHHHHQNPNNEKYDRLVPSYDHTS